LHVTLLQYVLIYDARLGHKVPQENTTQKVCMNQAIHDDNNTISAFMVKLAVSSHR